MSRTYSFKDTDDLAQQTFLPVPRSGSSILCTLTYSCDSHVAPRIGLVRARYGSLPQSITRRPSNMSAPAPVTMQTYEGVGITLLILASGFVAIRCFVSCYGPQHRPGIDDCALSSVHPAWITIADSARVLDHRFLLFDSIVRSQPCRLER